MADPEKPYDFEETPWAEAPTEIPPFPKARDLIEFQVGPTEKNRFFVDANSIVVGTDGIVRYVVVIKTVGGAENVALEGVRCAKQEYKTYALGRSDSTWDKIEPPQWRPIEYKTINRYRAVLSRDFFCPSGHTPDDREDARRGLLRGKHPDAL